MTETVAKAAFSIETGRLVLTLMPSLRCKHDCPHCYLSREQRDDPSILPLRELERICLSIAEWKEKRRLPALSVEAYWYGGEPTTLGIEYFEAACDLMERVFPRKNGNALRQTVLSSLVGVDPAWRKVFRARCDGAVQTSYDGLMRGSGYLRRWSAEVKAAVDDGLRVSTISVVNSELVAAGPEKVLDELIALGVSETSWLPFMRNGQNDSGAYARFAPDMNAYSDFMIRLTERAIELRSEGVAVPEIGQARFIIAQARAEGLSNIAGQTLFLMPDGSFQLPDYEDGWKERMLSFGNGLLLPFEKILSSPERRAYLRRQTLRNGNPECLECPHGDKCLMEFWKPNRPGDDCFGARRYVEWTLERAAAIAPPDDGATKLY
jgi:sulfatase maturation enzyme AslB (radical SAM superfamily)